MLTQITDKKRVKELELDTTHYVNAIHHSGNYMVVRSDMDKLHEIHSWHQGDGALTRLPLHKKVEYISNKLGFKPNYHVNYECRNAVWGFKSYPFGKEHENVLYYSNLGLSLQVDKSSTPFEVILLVKDIISLWEK